MTPSPDSYRGVPAIQAHLTRRGFIAASGGVVGALAFGSAASAHPKTGLGKSRLRLHVLADVHISDVYPMTINDMRTTLQDLDSVFPRPDALVIIGDLTEYGHAQDYSLFDLALRTSPHPDRVLLAIGNHEYTANEPGDLSKQRFLDYVGRDSLYYATEVGGYPFLILGSEAPGFNATITEAQLDWLESALNEHARKGRPTFVFLHQPPEISSNPARLVSLLAGAPNVVYFWGHYHIGLNWRTDGPDPTLLGDDEGYWRVQSPATTYDYLYARQPNGALTQTFMADWKQALAVEIFDHGVVIRGRDSYAKQWFDDFDATIPLD